MIPISDNIPTRHQPIINYFIIGFNVALFVWELKLDIAGELKDFLNHWGIVPARITTVLSDAFTDDNPAAWVAVVIVCSSLLSAMFLHSSFSQILGNLLFLFVFGKNIESILGHWRYLLFYLICGVLTNIFQVIVEPTLTVPLVGANGAIASVLGAYLLSFPKARVEAILPLVIVFIPVELPALFYLFWWFIQQAFYGIGSLNVPGGVNPVDVGYWAHGIGIGIGATWVWLMRRSIKPI